jgi:hypothetical protein
MVQVFEERQMIAIVEKSGNSRGTTTVLPSSNVRSQSPSLLPTRFNSSVEVSRIGVAPKNLTSTVEPNFDPAKVK